MCSFFCGCCYSSTSQVEAHTTAQETVKNAPLSKTQLAQSPQRRVEIQRKIEQVVERVRTEPQVEQKNNFLIPPPTPRYMIEKSTRSQSSDQVKQTHEDEKKSGSRSVPSKNEVFEFSISNIDTHIEGLQKKEVKHLCITGSPALFSDRAKILKLTQLSALEHIELVDTIGFFAGQFFEQKLHPKANKLICHLFEKITKLQTVVISGRSILKRSPSFKHIRLNPIKEEIQISRK